jgi:hypothetical protein
MFISTMFINNFIKINRNNRKILISCRNIFTNPKLGSILSKNINTSITITKSNILLSSSSSATFSKNYSNQIRSFSSSEVEKDNSSLTPGIQSKLKTLWKNYGAIAICTYIGIYAGAMTSVFFALDYDIFNAATFGLDPHQAVEKFCNLYEYFTSRTDLPEYIKQNPRGN